MWYPFSLFLDIVFPRRCLSCHKAGEYWCRLCQGLVVAAPRQCALCHVFTAIGQLCERCCRRHGFDTLWVTTEYHHGAIQQIIHALKFNFVSELAMPLGELLERSLPPLVGEWHIVPIPLAKKRQRWRGFNQAELIARVVADRRGWPLSTHFLIKPRQKKRQVGLTRAERLKNSQGLFVASLAAANRQIIIVDDVVTTGATLTAAVSALRAAGATRVVGLVVAHHFQKHSA